MTGGLSGPRRPEEALATDEPEKPKEDGPDGSEASVEGEAQAEAETGASGGGPGLNMPGVFGAASAVDVAKRIPPRAKLAGVLLQDGHAVGTDLPSLDQAEILAPWRAALGRGALYVRCIDRAVALPPEQAQRLARVGELWLDAALPPPDEILDVLVAGVHRFVVWPGEVDDLEEVLADLADAAALGWSDARSWEDAKRIALLHGIPVLVTFDPPEDRTDLDVYRLDLPDSGVFQVPLLAAPQPSAGAP